MPLHKRESVREEMLDSVYADRDLTATLPSKRFPDHEMSANEVFCAIGDELMLDGNARQNMATFCQTWEEPEIHRLMDISIDKNLIDKDEYPQTAELERRCVQMLADLWHAPERGRGRWGCSAIGSSEACMLGGMAAKWRWRAKRRADGKPTDKPQHGVRSGPGGVAQVRPLLGRGDAGDPDGAGALRHGRRARCSNGWTRTPSWWCPRSA